MVIKIFTVLDEFELDIKLGLNKNYFWQAKIKDAFMKPETYKILFLVTRAELGGAQNHIDLLIRNLSRRYHCILCSGSDGPLLEQAKKKGIEVHVLPQLSKKMFFPAFIAVCKLLKAEQPDLIHTHSAIASFTGRLAGRLAGIKTLYTVHGWHFVPNSVFQRRLFGWLLELVARPFTAAWITVSNFDLQFGIKSRVIDEQRAWVIPNGVEDLNIRKEKELKKGLRLVFIGRATFQKNCLDAIEILEQCNEKISLAMYVTSGDHLLALQKRINDSPAMRRVTLITDDPSASDTVQDYDAMLLTSRYEGMPLCALEAMRSGLTIVASDVCGMNEIVDHGETGFLYKFGDTQIAARYIEKLCDFELRQKFSKNARKKFMQNFLAKIMAQRTAEVYENILSK